MPSNMRNVSKGMEIWNFGQDAKDTFITIPDLIKRSEKKKKGLGDPITCFLDFKLPASPVLAP